MGVLLASAALVLVGLGVFPQEPLRRLAEGRLQAAVGGGSELGGLRIVPFLLKAELRDLRLQGRGYALIVPEARVVLAPRALTGALALRRLEMDSPVLELGADGVDETPDRASAALLPVEIEALAIRDARVSWSDPAAGELLVDGLSADGAIGSGPLMITAPRGAWRGETTFEVGAARARLSVSRELDVVLDSSETRLGTSTLRVRGPLVRRGEVLLALDLEAELDLSDAGPRLGQPELAGALDVAGRLEGPSDQVRVSLDAGGTAGWGSWSMDDLAVHLEAEQAGQTLARIEGRALGGRFEGEAELDGEETKGRLRGWDVDLADLPSEMRPPVSVEGAEVDVAWEGPLAGPLNVELAARGRGRHESAKARFEARARGTVRVEEGAADLAWTAALRGATTTAEVLELGMDARGRWRGAWPPEVTGDLSGTLNAAGGVPEDRMAWIGTFRAYGADLHARLDATGPLPLAVEVEIQGDRIQALSAAADPVDLARLGSPASGLASFQLEASGPLRSPDVVARVSVSSLEWDGAPLGRFEIGAEGTTERATLRAALPDLSIGIDGEIWASADGPHARGQAELRETSLARLSSLAGVTDPPDGHVSATLGFAAPLGHWTEAEATLDVSELEASHQGQLLRAQPFRAELREGRVAVRGVRSGGRDCPSTSTPAPASGRTHRWSCAPGSRRTWASCPCPRAGPWPGTSAAPSA